MIKTKHSFDTVAGLILICIFALALLFALGSGAGIYKEISSTMEYQYEARTAMGYVTAKARQYDCSGGVSLGSIDGVSALLLHEEVDGTAYVTYVYCHDGYVRELYTQDGLTFSADFGEKIIAAQALDFSLDGGLLRVDCTTDGASETAFVNIASAKEAAS